jgi:hypothetical protein
VGWCHCQQHGSDRGRQKAALGDWHVAVQVSVKGKVPALSQQAACHQFSASIFNELQVKLTKYLQLLESRPSQRFATARHNESIPPNSVTCGRQSRSRSSDIDQILLTWRRESVTCIAFAERTSNSACV